MSVNRAGTLDALWLKLSGFWLLGSFGSNVFYVVLNKNVGRQC